jgi:hypothetical protein
MLQRNNRRCNASDDYLFLIKARTPMFRTYLVLILFESDFC